MASSSGVMKSRSGWIRTSWSMVRSGRMQVVNFPVGARGVIQVRQNNASAAGKEVFQLHFHVIPSKGALADEASLIWYSVSARSLFVMKSDHGGGIAAP
ncbi:HIT domain-containing protein [Luteolibacter marinus]|uniref:HIT domain-containing protein n=1 Tax=Luteolibacter marinus TaxID=2776705 RepID=UPI003CCD92BF